MFNVEDVMRSELRFIENLLELLDKGGAGEMPEVKMYRVTTKNGSKYDVKISQGGRRISKRIGGDRSTEVIKIKQAKYEQELYRRLLNNKRVLEEALKNWEEYDADVIDEAIPETYRDNTGLVNKNPMNPYDKWQRTPHKRNGYDLPEDSNTTSDGTKVRSKSEVILYDLLTYLGIPFKYEVDVNLRNENNERVYKNADFVIPSMGEKDIVIEHLGLITDELYFENAMHKIRLYIMNGYKLNENLFLTADDGNGKINAYTSKELFEKMILPKLY